MLSFLASDVTKQPWFIIIALLAIFGFIVIAVILVRKYSKHFKNEEKPKSDKEIAEEEVNRLVVDIEDEKTQKEMNEAAEQMEDRIKKENVPSEKEVALEEVSRHTEEIEDSATLKAMEEYAKAHPEEANNVLKETSDKEDK